MKNANVMKKKTLMFHFECFCQANCLVTLINTTAEKIIPEISDG